MISNRAWVLLPSGRRLDLLNPDPQAWTDHDLSVALSRTYRWAGYSAWDLPLSVAQHSMTVLAIRQVSSGPGLTPPAGSAARAAARRRGGTAGRMGSDHPDQAASRTRL